jgi:hypothetical protein
VVVLLLSRTPDQGDQIGRIFAYWGIVFFGQFFLFTEGAFNFWPTFSKGKIMYIFILTKNGLGCILGDFTQTHLVTLIQTHIHLSGTFLLT